jgi:FG-GAP repeat
VAFQLSDISGIGFSFSKASGVSNPTRVCGRPKGLAMHDVNGDGKADIVITNCGDGTVTILLSNLTGR